MMIGVWLSSIADGSGPPRTDQQAADVAPSALANGGLPAPALSWLWRNPRVSSQGCSVSLDV
jgi:hypothetical protein